MLQHGRKHPWGRPRGAGLHRALVLGRVPARSLWPRPPSAEVVNWLGALGTGPPGTWACGLSHELSSSSLYISQEIAQSREV